MAYGKPEVEWFYDPSTYWKEYGLLGLAGKWSVVRATKFDFLSNAEEFEILATLDDRKTAIGFLKLLKEK